MAETIELDLSEDDLPRPVIYFMNAFNDCMVDKMRLVDEEDVTKTMVYNVMDECSIESKNALMESDYNSGGSESRYDELAEAQWGEIR